MNNDSSSILPFILLFGFFALLFAGNYYYQRKGRRYADEILREIPEEYNKQIKANAYRILVGRVIWGLIFLSGVIWNFQRVLANGFSWLTTFVIIFGVFFIVWGVLGFRWEMERLKS